ncbi:MAG: FeoB-associated Cys-rich membrane protein [Paludibacteraceae bacterium]
MDIIAYLIIVAAVSTALWQTFRKYKNKNDCDHACDGCSLRDVCGQKPSEKP